MRTILVDILSPNYLAKRPKLVINNLEAGLQQCWGKTLPHSPCHAEPLEFWETQNKVALVRKTSLEDDGEASRKPDHELSNATV